MQLTRPMKRVIEQQSLGFVATVSEDGRPNLSPKGTVAVWDDETIVFADLGSPRTVTNLRERPRVELNVVDPLARKGWRFRGTAEVLDAGPRFEEGVRFYAERDVVDAPRRIRSVVLVHVEEALPLISPAYSTGWTESKLRARWLRRYRALARGRPPPQDTERLTPSTARRSRGR